MENNPKFIRLLELLKELTPLRKLEWNEIFGFNSYGLDIENVRITIDRNHDGSSTDYYYIVQLLDERGVPLAVATRDSEEGESRPDLLAALFEVARHSAARVDEVIDRLIANMESRRPGGGKTSAR